MNRCVLVAGGLATALALLLAGCGSNVNTDGPFGSSSAPGGGGECIGVPRGGVATIGATEFPNSGGGQERIDKVTLVDAHDLQLIEAWVVPITGTNLIGVFRGYPPDGIPGQGPASLAPGVQWGHRQRAVGAVIPHTPGQDVINLVLVVKASGPQATSKTVFVDYESAGNHYRLDLHFFIHLLNGAQARCS